MFLFLILQLSEIALAADAQGSITTHYSPIKIVATPAGERDGECASLSLSMPSATRIITHDFCRSARVYDMEYGVIVINDNVKLSSLTVYYAKEDKIGRLSYRGKFARSRKLESSSFVLRNGNSDLLKVDLTLSFSGRNTIGPRTLDYRCITVDRVGLRDAAGKCR
jgi:hypothetical protein